VNGGEQAAPAEVQPAGAILAGMLRQVRQIQPFPNRKTVVGPLLILALFLLAGLVWLAVGGTVMRGAPRQAPRISSLL
jgi:hypothetical protein